MGHGFLLNAKLIGQKVYGYSFQNRVSGFWAIYHQITGGQTAATFNFPKKAVWE